MPMDQYFRDVNYLETVNAFSGRLPFFLPFYTNSVLPEYITARLGRIKKPIKLDN